MSTEGLWLVRINTSIKPARYILVCLLSNKPSARNMRPGCALVPCTQQSYKDDKFGSTDLCSRSKQLNSSCGTRHTVLTVEAS